MGSQGPGRKRTPSKNGLTAEEDALNVIAKEAEARLAAKRAARAEAREIRMKELERQQKEVSDDEERMSVGSRSNIRADDRLERDYLEKGSSRASTISGATLTSLGGTSSRRGSGDTSISADTEASIREIKDSLLEVEEKYRKAMVSNAQMDNEKTNMMYEVDTLKDSLMELEEMLFETRRELEEKCKDLEREKHAHSILQFQFSELKETLKQSEELLTKHGIVLGLDLATNGETEEEVGKADQNSQTASAEIREGSSVLGTHQLKVCKDQQQKDLDEGVPGNQQFSHAPLSSTNAPLEANENGDLGDQMNQGVEQLENTPEEPPSSVGDDELTATRPKEEIESEAHIPEDSRGNTVELECIVHKDEHLEAGPQEIECIKPSQVKKEETPLEFVSVHDEPDKPGETVLDEKPQEEPVESSQTEKLAKAQGVSASNKKKKKKKKNKQKQKPSDKQENDTKIDDKNEMVCSEDNPNQKTEGELEGNHQEPLGNDISETMMNTDVPHDAKRTSELDGIETTSTDINADDVKDKILIVTDEADLAGIPKTNSNLDCPDSSNDILSDDLSSNVISNPENIIDEHTENSTNPYSEAVAFSCELVSSEMETSLPHEPSAQSLDVVEEDFETISCSENTEKSSSVDMKEVKSYLNCEEKEQEENVQNIDLDGTSNPEDEDDSAHPSSPVMEKVENYAERVIQEQPIDQAMENQLQDSAGAELDREEVERQDEMDKENLKAPTEIVFDTQDRIGAELDQEEVERQDDLDKENLNVPTEKVSDTEDRIEEKMDQEEVESQDQLDKENLNVPSENVSDGSHVDNTSLIKTQLQVVHEDHLSSNGAIEESVGESSDQEPKVEKDEEERSIQNQLEVQLPEDEEDLLVKSDGAAQDLKEEDEEEDDGESFDFDEMDLEASSDTPLKEILDQSKEEGTLFKDDVKKASQEYQSNVTDEDQIQKEHLELADQESKPKEQVDDGQNTENPQTTTVIEVCSTEDRQVSSEVKPNEQQHDTSGNKEDAFEEHQQTSEDVTHSEGVNLLSEIKTKNEDQEISSSIQGENNMSSISGDQEETMERNKEDERKESKKSGKGKGKGKGKEECKMS